MFIRPAMPDINLFYFVLPAKAGTQSRPGLGSSVSASLTRIEHWVSCFDRMSL